MDDLISRQYVVECVYKALRTPPLKGVLTDTMSLAIRMVDELPTAQPEPKKGKWLRDPPEGGNALYKCSVCGKYWLHWWASAMTVEEMTKEVRCCPNCGADMREEKHNG